MKLGFEEIQTPYNSGSQRARAWTEQWVRAWVYCPNCGAEQIFNITKKQTLKARLDIVNLTDAIVELRDGAGVGVNAAQFGQRLGFFGSLSFQF